MPGKTYRLALLATIPFLTIAQRAPDPNLAYAQQGWSEADRNKYYSTSQGSRLMPMAWMQALERWQDDILWMTPDNIARFRYLTYTTPSGSTLPVGFAEDSQRDDDLRITRLRWQRNQGNREPWIGFTCAACHTGEVAVGERRLRIDGAPGQGDFHSFVEQVDRSLATTLSDPQKWARFTRRVLGARNNSANQQRLGTAVDQLLAYRRQIAGMNATPIRYGFSRVDAIGYIFNQASYFSQAGTPIANEPTAPVSYPFLWNVTQHDVVQWNDSVANRRIPIHGGRYLDVGALGRNTGEVIGVFGEVRTRRPLRVLPLCPFASSVRVHDLVELETQLERLLPPAWPEDLLGRIDLPRAARGRVTYDRECASCHVPLARTDLTTPIVAQMSWLPPSAPDHENGRPNIPPGTDPSMACNAYYNSAATGRLEGYRSGGERLGVVAPLLDMLSIEVLGAMAGGWREILGTTFEIYEGGGRARTNNARPPAAAAAPRVRSGAPGARPVAAAATADPYPGLPQSYRGCVNRTTWDPNEDKILGYKARPLTGIWATGPYLHNGSVPNLYELLLPPERRSRTFWVGTRQYDPVRVGFQTSPSNENSFLFRTRDENDNILWGNFNGGHDYNNAAMTEQQRLDLLEYLKTL